MNVSQSAPSATNHLNGTNFNLLYLKIGLERNTALTNQSLLQSLFGTAVYIFIYNVFNRMIWHVLVTADFAEAGLIYCS